MTRFVFYDFETTGTSVTYAQPLQFAAIVTDENFNVLDTVDWRCRIAPHILPAPYALKVTNLAPEQVTNNNLQSAFEFAQSLHQFLEKWQPAIWLGYNTIKFDEPMLRQLFYQNLQPNIYATSMNGNSRLDVMKMVWAAYSLRPGILTFPENDKGKPSFKLDQLAPANGFGHENAHDALADVEATIFILNKIKTADPEFLNDLVRTQDKEYVGSLLRSFEAVQVTMRFGGAPPKTYYGCYCGTNIQNKNEIAFVDFDAIDAETLLGLSDPEILEAIMQSPKIIRPLRLNNAETIMRLDNPTALQRSFCEKISRSDDLISRVSSILPQRFEELEEQGDIPVEEKIHGGFYSHYDQDVLTEFQTADWQRRQELVEQFEDKRLVQLGRRLIVFYAPHLLSKEQNSAFKSFVKVKWESTDQDADWTKICNVQDDLNEMKTDETVSKEYLERLINFYHSYLKDFECEVSL
ncbi:exonuclease domain-containing protein [Paracoccaceae bacterium]|nr:exonuclease domain-containing protein [Paracoccaceae bacterium]